MSNFTGPWQAMRAFESRVEQTKQNSARQAYSYSMIDTSGAGELMHPPCVEFSCTFIEEPSIAHGFAINGDTLEKGYFPRVYGGVHRWRRNRRGHYTGCWVFFTVDTADDRSFKINHYFTFAGVAIKDLPDHLLDL